MLNIGFRSCQLCLIENSERDLFSYTWVCVFVYIKQVCEYQKQSLFKGNQFVPSLKGSASVRTLSVILPHYTHWWTAVTTAVASPSDGPVNSWTALATTQIGCFTNQSYFLSFHDFLFVFETWQNTKDMIIHNKCLASVQKQIHIMQQHQNRLETNEMDSSEWSIQNSSRAKIHELTVIVTFL